jgi:3,4-dihydroxy 2-butanone 4-phosphate synthase
MRKAGGGLICTTAHNDIVTALDLPFLAEVFACAARDHAVMDLLSPNDIPYDTKSAFSITINHRHTFTGVTDRDRALTISEFAKLAKRVGNENPMALREEFGRSLTAMPSPRRTRTIMPRATVWCSLRAVRSWMLGKNGGRPKWSG